jgi:hypothetical protein
LLIPSAQREHREHAGPPERARNRADLSQLAQVFVLDRDVDAKRVARAALVSFQDNFADSEQLLTAPADRA